MSAMPPKADVASAIGRVLRFITTHAEMSANGDIVRQAYSAAYAFRLSAPWRTSRLESAL
jgi:hypothetical protein